MRNLLGPAVTYTAILLLPVAAQPISISAEETIVLSVVSAGVDHDVRTGKPFLAIKLDEASRRTFSTFSSTYVGGKTELRVHGKLSPSPYPPFIALREDHVFGQSHDALPIRVGETLGTNLGSGSDDIRRRRQMPSARSHARLLIM